MVKLKKKSLSRGSFRTHGRVIGNKNFFIFGLIEIYYRDSKKQRPQSACAVLSAADLWLCFSHNMQKAGSLLARLILLHHDNTPV